METSSRKSSGPVLPISSAFRRSISPSGRFSSSYAVCTGASSSAFASSSSSFSSRSSTFFHHNRPSSPTRVNLVGASPAPVPSVRFSLDQHRRPTSPGRSLAVADHHLSPRPIASPAPQRRTCMCSPTNHPGSFRCSLHKGLHLHPHHQNHASFSPSNRLNARRSAMTNSLVRIGTVEGEWVKRALTALIRPSSHQQRRRAAFQPRRSRLSVMSKADDP
ncbi:uncharacterized protein [Elaeis guineensis]|uniref:Uncharacterized protein LOC105049415 n=1 Tax=Elaeis guineensis var. tenera TaxID=51953 RepID=A0A6J0PLK7_ELAGV|nr:uncharacterized protein LOC105049415 [Elaeis guineensis]XP_019707723.1 uncharacterized protein LOC105049415 [Elaeis guineensis]